MFSVRYKICNNKLIITHTRSYDIAIRELGELLLQITTIGPWYRPNYTAIDVFNQCFRTIRLKSHPKVYARPDSVVHHVRSSSSSHAKPRCVN